MRSVTRLLTWAVLGAMVTTACAAPGTTLTGPTDSPTRPSAPKRISVAIRGTPSALSSLIDGLGAGSVPGVAEVERMINGGLTITDQEATIRPQLAREVPTLENGLWKVMPDGRMETTWNLREGIRWHDGTPMTSADAVFATEIERDPGLELAINPIYRTVESVEAPDPHTVKVTWKEPFIRADILFNEDTLPLPKHLLEDIYRTQKETFTGLPYWNAGFIGTGPFKVRDFNPGVGAVLVKNTDYVLGAPQIDEVEVRFITDPGTLGANVLAGGVDMTLGGRLSLDWGIQIRDQWRDGKMVTELTNPISAWPQFLNPSPPILANVQFRKALMHAVDRTQLSEAIVAGLSPIANSIVPPNAAEYRQIESGIVRYPFDPQRAAQMIEALGYSRGSTGMYQGPDGQPLRVEIRTRNNDEAQVKTTLSMADYWEKAGMSVDQVHFAAQQANDREWRATRPAFEVVRQPGGVDTFIRYQTSAIPLPENRFSGENRTRYGNPELDSLVQRFNATIPMGERMRLGTQIITHLTDQVIVMSMFYDVIPTMVSNRLTNVVGPGYVWDVHVWGVK
jgi:peptide/nickel transport system substrate-binding protein